MLTADQKISCINRYVQNDMFSIRKGRVWRIRKFTSQKSVTKIRPKLADKRFSSNGYRRVSLSMFGTEYEVQAHRLIMSIIQGSAIGHDDIVDHLDSNKLNNDPSNLHLTTHDLNLEKAHWVRRLKCHSNPEAEITAHLIRESAKHFGLCAQRTS